MALEDMYGKLNFVEYRRVPDGFGGWKGQWDIGEEFSGLITLASDMTQNTEALRGNLTKQYKVSCPLKTPLKKGDKIAFDFLKNGQIEYAEITNDGIIPPTQASTQFVLFSAQSWELKNE
jgi:hypothetical protein